MSSARKMIRRDELGDTHKPEAIAQSNICFRSFLPSLTLWLSPNVLTVFTSYNNKTSARVSASTRSR